MFLKEKLHRVWVQIYNYIESNILTHYQITGGRTMIFWLYQQREEMVPKNNKKEQFKHCWFVSFNDTKHW